MLHVLQHALASDVPGKKSAQHLAPWSASGDAGESRIRRRTTTRHGPYRMNEAMVHELETHPSRSLPCCGLSWPSEHRSELVRPIECSELPSCIVFGLCHQLTPTTAQSVCALRPKRCSQEEGEHWSGSTSGNVPLTVPSQMVDALSRIDCMVSTRFQEIGVR